MYLREACSRQAGNPGGRGRGRLTRNARGGRSPLARAVLGAARYGLPVGLIAAANDGATLRS